MKDVLFKVVLPERRCIPLEIDTQQVCVPGKCFHAKVGKTLSDRDVRQVAAKVKSAQGPAEMKRAIGNIGDVVRNHKPREAGTTLKCPKHPPITVFLDRRDIFANREICKTFAKTECCVTKGSHAVGNSHFCQRRSFERTIYN